MSLALTFVGDWPSDLRDVGERILAAAQAELPDLPAGTINIKLVDDAEIAALNTHYNDNAYATDVLTFSYTEDGAIEGELADVVISTETAALQAKEASTSLANEIGLLICHGLLHTLGYDHHDQAGRERMNTLQQRMLDQAGLSYRDFAWKS